MWPFRSRRSRSERWNNRALKLLITICSLISREKQFIADRREWRRGSLYSHEELAIAYAFGFEHFPCCESQRCETRRACKSLLCQTSRSSNALLRCCRWSRRPSKPRDGHVVFATLSLDPLRWGRRGHIHRPRRSAEAEDASWRCGAITALIEPPIMSLLTSRGNRSERWQQIDHGDRMLLKASGFRGYEHNDLANSSAHSTCWR